jgi:peptidoglycan/xylan/chitin deacetylase (PgdA/CDA1 family)
MVFDPRTTWGYPLITHLPEGYGNAVALTFDDGPHPATTPELLDILAGQGAMATFFLVAERAKAYPHLTRRIVAEGHTIGVHGLRHRAMVGQSAPALRSELAEAERIFTEILGTPLPHRLLRPPHGFKTPTVCRTAVQEGWQIVSWSFDPHDYDSLTPETLLQRLQTQGKAGDIILLHERPDTPLINQALPSFLRHLHEQGLKTVSLS